MIRAAALFLGVFYLPGADWARAAAAIAGRSRPGGPPAQRAAAAELHALAAARRLVLTLSSNFG